MKVPVQLHERVGEVAVLFLLAAGDDQVALAPGQILQPLELLVGGVFRHQLHGLRLHDETDLIPVLQQLFLVLGKGEAEGVLQLARRLGDKGSHAPADHQDAAGHQGLDGLPQGGAADPHLDGEAPLVRQTVAGLEPVLVKNHAAQLGGDLLGEGLRCAAA